MELYALNNILERFVNRLVKSDKVDADSAGEVAEIMAQTVKAEYGDKAAKEALVAMLEGAMNALRDSL